MSETRLGKYRILEEIGRGGFATVFRALDTTLDREVALKILHPQLLVDRNFVERFGREARALASLRHPHIVTAHEIAEAEGRLFIAMELARGPNLAFTIAEAGPMSWRAVLELLKPVCEALEYAHNQGVIHRDLKPTNILLDEERGALLSDFGFARLMRGSSVSLSLSGGVLGTPPYIAPEVWEYDAAEAPADIYALGCIVYEMLTGQVLFGGNTPMQVLRAHDRGPQFPETWPEGVPEGVEGVLAKALARDPGDRYASVDALWHALKDTEAQAQASREERERMALAAQWRAGAERAIAAEEWGIARMAVGRWLAANPQDADARAALARIDQEQASERPMEPAPSLSERSPTPIPRPRRAEAEVKPPRAERDASAAPAERISAAPAEKGRWAPTWGLILAGLAVVVLVIILVVGTRGREKEVEVTRVVTEEKVVVETVIEKQTIIEEQTVLETVVETVEVTPEPEVVEPVEFVAPDPETYTFVSFGDPDTLDINLNYETSGGELIMNVAEGLIFYNHTDGTSYVPQLATEVPTVANGGISEDGKTYTFKIRQGVKFHNGNGLTPSDFAYTFQRGLLQSSPYGPQWLLIEPIMGYASGDITEEIADGAYAGDPEALKAYVTPEELVAVCEKVKAAVVADDEAWTLTFNLAQPWGPFLATLAQGWGYAMDKDWVIENGGWDGSCDTWVDMEYAMTPENDPLTDKINGTGPYMLDHWTPGEEYVLVANENYWRQPGDEIWPGGPSGVASIKRIVYKVVSEWATRFAILQVGNAEQVYVPTANRPQADAIVGEFCQWDTFECEPNPENPDGSLRKWGGLPSVSRYNVFLNFDLSQEEGVNQYSGSGQLDGNGIPPDFFADIHVRRAMNYCFDYEAFIADAQNGEGVRNNGPIIKYMLGYNEDGPMYEFDLDKCEAELTEAHGGVLPGVGFQFQMAYNTGNLTRQTACEILQSSLSRINSSYQVECLGLPWPTMLRAFRAGQLPAVAYPRFEDIHDPHSWVQPLTVGTWAGWQNLDPEIKAQFQELVTAGVMASEPAEREQIYFELQQLFYDAAIQIVLSQNTDARYEQRWVKDYFFRVGAVGQYFYAYGLEGGE